VPVYLPKNINEVTRLLVDEPDATLLGGGTDVMVEVNFNHRKPRTVVALRHVAELREWTIDNASGTVRIGALVPYKEMESGELSRALPALAQAARTVGSPQIRAAGSIGGNLGTCSPAGDSLPVLAALDAIVHVASTSGQRDLSFSEFMVGPKRNSLQPGELITGVTVPVQRGRQGYAKVGVRNAMVISVASACFAYQDGTVRLALGSVGPTIIRCTEAERFAHDNVDENGRFTPEQAREFGQIASGESRPIDDHRSTAAYRRHAIGVLTERLALRGEQQ
jgi:CO/xanthine dehydrogenase FAD-binding subunit